MLVMNHHNVNIWKKLNSLRTCCACKNSNDKFMLFDCKFQNTMCNSTAVVLMVVHISIS